jgi:SAM-dependent methyltransferase
MSWASGLPVLELGVGTGRVALELVRCGRRVDGIDTSERMLMRLRAKDPSKSINAWIDDISNFTAPVRYGLVCVLTSTFFMLLSRQEQESCFAAVADCLLPKGSFVVECQVPQLDRFHRDQFVEVASMDVDAIDLLVARHQPLTQRVDYQRIRFTEAGTRLLPLSYRYAFPPELDEMAGLAGLTLAERHGGWRDEPFGKGSRHHISRYIAADR